MTVLKTHTEKFYDGNGTGTSFAVDFDYHASADVKLQRIDNDGKIFDIVNGFYFDTVNHVIHYPGYPPGQEPPSNEWPPVLPIGEKLRIYRVTPVVQDVNFPDSTMLEQIEDLFDKFAMLIQESYRGLAEYGSQVLEALKTSKEAKHDSENALKTSEDASKMAKEANEKSEEAVRISDEAKITSEDAEKIAADSKEIAEGIEGKASDALDASEDAVKRVEELEKKFDGAALGDATTLNGSSKDEILQEAEEKSQELIDENSKILKPGESDIGKIPIYKGDGEFSWEFQKTHHVGEIFAFAGETPPVGSAECKGQIMSKSTYPDLFAAIGYTWGGSGDDFYLPNFYDAARFLRSRSSSLAVGTLQEDAIRNITGNLTQLFSDANSTGNGAFIKSSRVVNAGYTGGTVAGGANYNFSAERVVPTAEENRPVSATVIYCIQITDEYINPAQIDISVLANDIAEMKTRTVYPPLFIQGFKINYLSSNRVGISSGSCRDITNKFNIDFTMSSDYLLDVSGYKASSSVFIFCILKVDGSVSFAHNDNPHYNLKESELAYRRIGSVTWEGVTGLVGFASYITGTGLTIRYTKNYNNFTWQGAAPESSPYVTTFKMTCPSGISVEVIGILAHGIVDVGAWQYILIRKNSTFESICEGDGSPSATNFREVFYADLDSKESLMNIRIATQPSLRATASVYTYGFTDRRID